jgi:hypothetical protein
LAGVSEKSLFFIGGKSGPWAEAERIKRERDAVTTIALKQRDMAE